MNVRIAWGRPTEDEDSVPRMARMGHWQAHPVAPEPVSVAVLPSARVYPGNIQSRTGEQHLGGQLLLDAALQIIPASYSMMDGRPSLPTDVDVHAPAVDLAGDHFFLGSVHPHFGHVMLEGLARVWAFEAFIKAHPLGRVVIYEPWTPDFALTLLELAGIAPDRLFCLTQPVVVERLHVPSIAYRSHRWMTGDQAGTWRAIADRATPVPQPPRRIYLSRRGIASRALVEEEAVEAIFAEAGFLIVRPETLTMIEQIRLARSAAVLAGCVGSQMYLAAFQPEGAQTLVLAPSNFFLADDALIAQGMGHSLTVAFGGQSAYREPQGPWSIDLAAARSLIAGLDS